MIASTLHCFAENADFYIFTVSVPSNGSEQLGLEHLIVLTGARLLLIVYIKSTAFITLPIIVGLIGHSAMDGPQAPFFSELFGTQVRYGGASLGYQLTPSPAASPYAPHQQAA